MIKPITSFDCAAPWILGAEGGYVNIIGDRGSATKYGISLRYLILKPDSDGDGFKDGDLNHDGLIDFNDVQILTERQALAIYETDFWTAGRCGEMPRHVALALFDGRVNHSPKVAAMLVQRALRVDQDGLIGPATIRAACDSDPATFLGYYLAHRAQFYADLVRMDSTQAQFELGWYRRLFLLQAYILRA